MTSLRPYRMIFLIAFLWNAGAGVNALLSLSDNFQAFYGQSVTPDNWLTFLGWEAFWVSVLLFGAGYLMLAVNPLKNHGIVWLAIIGKTHIGVHWILLYLEGQAQLLALLGGLGDVAFALLFLVVLWKLRHLSA